MEIDTPNYGYLEGLFVKYADPNAKIWTKEGWTTKEKGPLILRLNRIIIDIVLPNLQKWEAQAVQLFTNLKKVSLFSQGNYEKIHSQLRYFQKTLVKIQSNQVVLSLFLNDIEWSLKDIEEACQCQNIAFLDHFFIKGKLPSGWYGPNSPSVAVMRCLENHIPDYITHLTKQLRLNSKGIDRFNPSWNKFLMMRDPAYFTEVRKLTMPNHRFQENPSREDFLAAAHLFSYWGLSDCLQFLSEVTSLSSLLNLVSRSNSDHFPSKTPLMCAYEGCYQWSAMPDGSEKEDYKKKMVRTVLFLHSLKPDLSIQDDISSNYLHYVLQFGTEELIFHFVRIIKEQEGVLSTLLKQANLSGHTPLVYLCRRLGEGRLSSLAVEWIKEGLADPAEFDDLGESPLSLAAEKNDLPVLRALLEAQKKAPDQDFGLEAGRATWDEDTPVMVACQSHSSGPTVRLLMDAGANISYVNETKETLLMHAAGCGMLETVRELLALIKEGKAEIDIDAMDEHEEVEGKTALMRSIARGYEEVALLLVEAGADVSVVNNENYTALHYVAGAKFYPEEERSTEMLRLLEVLLQLHKEKGVDIGLYKKYDEGCTPVGHALEADTYQTGMRLIEEIDDVDLLADALQDILKNLEIPEEAMEITPAFVKMVRALLDKVPNEKTPFIRNVDEKSGSTYPMLLFNQKGSIPIIEELALLLVSRGADVSVRNKRNETLLFKAAYTGASSVVDYLLGLRATDIGLNLVHESGGTPFLAACTGDYFGIARKLMAAGVSPLQSITGGLTAYALAYVKGEDLTPKDITLRINNSFEIRAHRWILQNGGAFFQGMLGGSFAESQKTVLTITVPCTEEIFKQYIDFYYYQDLDITYENFKELASYVDYFQDNYLRAKLFQWWKDHPECGHWAKYLQNPLRGEKRLAGSDPVKDGKGEKVQRID